MKTKVANYLSVRTWGKYSSDTLLIDRNSLDRIGSEVDGYMENPGFCLWGALLGRAGG